MYCLGLLWESDFTEKLGVSIDLNKDFQNFLWNGIFKKLFQKVAQSNFGTGSALNDKMGQEGRWVVFPHLLV